MTTPQLGGKVAVVTGANSGLGKATAEALANLGARVVMVGRNELKLERARRAICDRVANAQLAIELADFAHLDQVRELGRRVKTDHPQLDILINNAGVALYQRTVTDDGYEMTFAVNHLAPFLLTHSLLPSLRHAPKARIVNVSSEAYRWGKLDFDDLHTLQQYSIRRAYNRSKLCNLLFTRFLVGRLVGTNVTVNAVHPGLVNTGMGTGGNLPTRLLWSVLKTLGISPRRGARTQVWLASSKELQGITGGYFAHCKRAKLRAVAQDDTSAARLWEISCKMTGINSHDYGEDSDEARSTVSSDPPSP